MNTNSTESEEAQTAGEYVLGTLRGEDRDQFETELADSQKLQGAVRSWEKAFEPANDIVTSVLPPSRVWNKIEQKVHGVSTIAREATHWWDSLRLWRGLVFASVLGFMFISFVPLMKDVSPVSTLELPSYNMVMKDKENQPLWLIACDWEKRTMQITLLVQPSLDKGKSHELWLISKKTQAPISLGLLDQNNSKIALPLDSTWKNTKAFAVSLEPKGGSTTGQPTGPVLYVVPTPKV